jgi:hypothetical protein
MGFSCKLQKIVNFDRVRKNNVSRSSNIEENVKSLLEMVPVKILLNFGNYIRKLQLGF